MKIDPYTNGGALRSQLEALSRAQVQELAEEVVRELSRRAFKTEEAEEQKRKAADVPRHRPLGW